jgi:hypothetical protein
MPHIPPRPLVPTTPPAHPVLPVTEDADLNRFFSVISAEMADATIHWRLYKDLNGLVKDYLFEFNQSPCFWQLTLAAHLSTALSRLGRLYDKTPGALSLPNFLPTLQAYRAYFHDAAFRARLANNEYVDVLAKNRILCPAIIESDLARVRRSDALVHSLLVYRNKHVAHRDAHVVLGHESADLPFSHIEELLSRAREIINYYSLLYRASTQSVRMIGDDDHRMVLRSVRHYIEAQERAIADEIAREQDGGQGASPAADA